MFEEGTFDIQIIYRNTNLKRIVKELGPINV